MFAAGQWAILSLTAKLGGSEMLGQYALALAVATPIAMLSHLNLRAVLATDIERRHPFGDYLAVRLATVAAGLAATLAVAWGFGYGWPRAVAIILAGLVLNLDNLSDIYYGALQRRERMDKVAVSMGARGVLSAPAFGLAIAWTHSLAAGMAALALSRAAVLLLYDIPTAIPGESLERAGAQGAIFRTALPLGIVLMLTALTANLPRYAIERDLGAAQLGAYAAVASFIAVGSTIMNALGQAATPRLARYSSGRELRLFRGLALKLAGIAFLLGCAGVAVAAVLGPFVLRLLYRPEYTAYAGLLVWVMAAAVLAYVSMALGFVVTSTRAFAAQAPLLAVVAATAGMASWALVPRFGLEGAVIALAAAWAAQIAGQLSILGRREMPA